LKRSILFALSIATFANAGMSRPKELSLEQVVEQASLVVVAVRDTPSVAPKLADLGAGRQKYPYNAIRFRILETLRGSATPTAPDKIDVVASDLGTLLFLERNSLSKSFFSEYFSAGKNLLESRDTLILFLEGANDRGEHPLVANDACLPHSRKKTIQGMLSGKP